jgi:hypothetical protein
MEAIRLFLEVNDLAGQPDNLKTWWRWLRALPSIFQTSILASIVTTLIPLAKKVDLSSLGEPGWNLLTGLWTALVRYGALVGPIMGGIVVGLAVRRYGVPKRDQVSGVFPPGASVRLKYQTQPGATAFMLLENGPVELHLDMWAKIIGHISMFATVRCHGWYQAEIEDTHRSSVILKSNESVRVELATQSLSARPPMRAITINGYCNGVRGEVLQALSVSNGEIATVDLHVRPYGYPDSVHPGWKKTATIQASTHGIQAVKPPGPSTIRDPGRAARDKG